MHEAGRFSRGCGSLSPAAASHAAALRCCRCGEAQSAAACSAAWHCRRCSPKILHTCLCLPSRQSACEQAVPQYHTARQALQGVQAWRDGCHGVRMANAGQEFGRSAQLPPMHAPLASQVAHLLANMHACHYITQSTIALTCTACCPPLGPQLGRPPPAGWSRKGRRSSCRQPPVPAPPVQPAHAPAALDTAQ